MRSDLDTSRGIFWWAVVPLLLLVVSGVALAAPTDAVRVCRGGNPSFEGQVIDAQCASAGGSVMDVTVATLFASDMVGGLDDTFGDYRMWLPATLEGNPSYPFHPFDPPSTCCHASFAALEWEGGGGDADPEDPDDGEWSYHDLDMQELGFVFALGFSLVGTFWGLGKGLGIVIGFMRRL